VIPAEHLLSISLLEEEGSEGIVNTVCGVKWIARQASHLESIVKPQIHSSRRGS